MKKVAVTGGLSSGKSTVLGFFQDLGVPVISADTLVHEILSNDSSVSQTLWSRYKNRAFNEDTVDRNRLAQIVFNDPNELKFLENLIHPIVRTKIQQAYEEAKQSSNAPFFVAEVPLLFESGGEKDYDAVVVVEAPIHHCLERYRAKRGSEEGFFKRLKRHIPMERKKDHATFVVDNSGSLDSVKLAVQRCYEQLANL